MASTLTTLTRVRSKRRWRKHAHTRTQYYTHSHIHTHTRARAHTHNTCKLDRPADPPAGQSHSYAHMHARTHACTHAHTHTRTPKYAHPHLGAESRTQINTHTHARARAHTRTYTHTLQFTRVSTEVRSGELILVALNCVELKCTRNCIPSLSLPVNFQVEFERAGGTGLVPVAHGAPFQLEGQLIAHSGTVPRLPTCVVSQCTLRPGPGRRLMLRRQFAQWQLASESHCPHQWQILPVTPSRGRTGCTKSPTIGRSGWPADMPAVRIPPPPPPLRLHPPHIRPLVLPLLGQIGRLMWPTVA